MSSTTHLSNALVDAAPSIVRALHRWEEAAYRSHHVLAWYGADTRPFRSARADEAVALAELRRVVPAGAWYVIPRIEGDRIVGWEDGEFQIRSENAKGESR